MESICLTPSHVTQFRLGYDDFTRHFQQETVHAAFKQAGCYRPIGISCPAINQGRSYLWAEDTAYAPAWLLVYHGVPCVYEEEMSIIATDEENNITQPQIFARM